MARRDRVRRRSSSTSKRSNPGISKRASVAAADAQLSRADRAHLIHGFGSPALVDQQGTIRLVKGRGVYVWDSQGRRYVDGLASLWNVAVGHGRAEIARAAARQMRALEYAPTLLGFSSEPAIRLAARLVSKAPKGLTRVVFTSGGSESNETVIRLVRLYWRLRGRPDKIQIVALDRAYHGSSTGAASLTGLPHFHQYYEPLLPGVLRMPRPYAYRCEFQCSYPRCDLTCADELERMVAREGADKIGAFIAEPVQGVGGVIVPPPGYFERIREICDRHQILLIVDEVITGFGRLGTWFGIQRWNATPDMLVFAKGVTSGYLPLGGVMLREQIFDTLLQAGPGFSLHHGFTYSGHPTVCAAALANLDIIERERLIPAVRRKARHFERRMRQLATLPIVGEVRCAGLMGAVELVRDRETKAPLAESLRVPARIRAAALRRGVIVRAGADTIALCPPLIITTDQIDLLTRVLREAIGEVGEELSQVNALTSPAAATTAATGRTLPLPGVP
jgi:putrescine aminotransferase